MMLIAEVEAAAVDFSSFISALKGAITPAQLLTVLTTVVGVGMGFVLMWFGVRKILNLFTSALRNGNINI